MSVLNKIVEKKRDRLAYSQSRTPLKELKSVIRNIEHPRIQESSRRQLKGIQGILSLSLKLKKHLLLKALSGRISTMKR
jgi:hypothetical protein